MGLILNGEKNLPALLTLITQLALDISDADAACLYYIEDNVLHYSRVYIKSQNRLLTNDLTSEIPMMPIQLNDMNNNCAICLQQNQIIHIPNIDQCTSYDTTKIKYFDRKIGYHSQSTIYVPLVTNENEPLGVMQLTNRLDSDNHIVPFKNEDNGLIYFSAAQAGTAIQNIKYTNEIKDLLYSFAEVITTAIDERSSYNADHTRNVANYVKRFIKYYNEQYKLGYVKEYIDTNRSEQLYLAALLHDIGKITVPLEIMNKSTRLSSHLEKILSRFELFRCYFKIDYLEHTITEEVYQQKLQKLNEIQDFILMVNEVPCLTDEMVKQIEEYSSYVYYCSDGSDIPYFTTYELECLSIRKGTLTNKERQTMQGHVTTTAKMLSHFKFSHNFDKIETWANNHHEYLDGSGYPNHLTANELSLEERILCIADIYDALVATDRPYKSPMSQNKALSILEEMALEGKLDHSLVLLFSDMLNYTNHTK